MSYEWLTLAGYWNDFVHAAWLTLQITLLAFILAMLLGLLTALASASPRPIVARDRQCLY